MCVFGAFFLNQIRLSRYKVDRIYELEGAHWCGVDGYIMTKQYKTFQFYIVTKLKPKICIQIGVIKTVINYYITPYYILISKMKSVARNAKESSSKKPAKRAARAQRAPNHKLRFNEFEILTKHSIGNAGEEFICNTIPCETCGHTKWTNLNKVQMNYPGVDLCCDYCGTYVQVKTMCSKNGSCPLSQASNGAWKFPTSKNTVRETLKMLKGNIRYIAVVYDTNYNIIEVSITGLLSSKNIHYTENYIVSDDIKYYPPRILRTLKSICEVK